MRASYQVENDQLLIESSKLLSGNDSIDLAPSDLLIKARNLWRAIPSFQSRNWEPVAVNGRGGMLLERWRNFPVKPSTLTLKIRQLSPLTPFSLNA